MSVYTDMASFFFDVLSYYAEKNGNAAVSSEFDWLSDATSAYGELEEENTIVAGATILAGLSAMVLFGPELLTAEAITIVASDTIIPFFGAFSITVSGTTAEAVASAMMGTSLMTAGSSLYTSALAAENGILSAFGVSQTATTVGGDPGFNFTLANSQQLQYDATTGLFSLVPGTYAAFPSGGTLSDPSRMANAKSLFGRSMTDPIVLDLSSGGTGVQLTPGHLEKWRPPSICASLIL